MFKVLLTYCIIYSTFPLPNCSQAIMLKRLNTVRDFMTDGNQKVKDTHEADCRGINPVGYPCVFMVDPPERDATKGFF